MAYLLNEKNKNSEIRMSETVNKSDSLFQTRMILNDSHAGQSEDYPRPRLVTFKSIYFTGKLG